MERTARIIEVTDSLLAEALPDGRIRWLEKVVKVVDNSHMGRGYQPVKRTGGLMGIGVFGVPHKHNQEWDQTDPSFDDIVRIIEDG